MPDGASYRCEDWLYPPYARRGVACNLEFHSDYTEMVQRGWDVAATLDKGLSASVSYLNTDAYDLAAMGTWQRLQVVAEVPTNAGSADLAVERGDLEPEITIDLRLDDLQVEVIEAP